MSMSHDGVRREPPIHEANVGILKGDWVPTMHLRIAVPSGTHVPEQQQLQQKWEARTIHNRIITEWRPIERVLV